MRYQTGKVVLEDHFQSFGAAVFQVNGLVREVPDSAEGVIARGHTNELALGYPEPVAVGLDLLAVRKVQDRAIVVLYSDLDAVGQGQIVAILTDVQGSAVLDVDPEAMHLHVYILRRTEVKAGSRGVVASGIGRACAVALGIQVADEGVIESYTHE